MITVDLHSHTKYSHAQASSQEMYNAALIKGLKIFGFSEHSPRPSAYIYPQDYQERLNANFKNYHNEVKALQNNSDGILVLHGLELDYIREEESYVKTLCQAEAYDYVIAGLHFLGKWGFDSSAKDWEVLSEEQAFKYYEEYYNDLYRLTQTGLFNIVAHPDLIKIFSVHIFKRWLNMPSSQALVYKALKGIKESGMAMEISSAGLRKPCNEIYPCDVLMQMAAELKLPISFGSDAHCVNTVAFGFDLLETYAKKFGFTQSVYFKERKMISQAF
ncbi:histidinol-phosphatase [Desulfovibrio litoralis]|uniref:Histidinol-phosphatase n=1 Tax=Desulfovibrio litoralis DSM 11393 TaxID=1121455 RepID=A0A1M7TEM9_9BACT|nr:histidinol-phosphatase [Desulfovibrio litoralis]SHN69209.1 histidinol-phosphatase (PHP family) [Desulfovibrio litoralis DSM 11393]